MDHFGSSSLEAPSSLPGSKTVNLLLTSLQLIRELLLVQVRIPGHQIQLEKLELCSSFSDLQTVYYGQFAEDTLVKGQIAQIIGQEEEDQVNV
jgi:hypothetical protein